MQGFRRFMAKTLGKGLWKIDILLEEETFKRGDKIKGILDIYGGKFDYEITSVTVRVETMYRSDENTSYADKLCVFQQIEVPFNNIMEKGDTYKLEFEFYLSDNCTFSIENNAVRIRALMDCPYCLKTEGVTKINVIRDERLDKLLKSLEGMGLKKTSEYNLYKFNESFKVQQCYNLKLEENSLEKYIYRIQFYLVYNMYKIKILVELFDKKMEVLDFYDDINQELKKRYIQITISNKELEDEESLQNKIQSQFKNLYENDLWNENN